MDDGESFWWLVLGDGIVAVDHEDGVWGGVGDGGFDEGRPIVVEGGVWELVGVVPITHLWRIWDICVVWIDGCDGEGLSWVGDGDPFMVFWSADEEKWVIGHVLGPFCNEYAPPV